MSELVTHEGAFFPKDVCCGNPKCHSKKNMNMRTHAYERFKHSLNIHSEITLKKIPRHMYVALKGTSGKGFLHQVLCKTPPPYNVLRRRSPLLTSVCRKAHFRPLGAPSRESPKRVPKLCSFPLIYYNVQTVFLVEPLPPSGRIGVPPGQIKKKKKAALGGEPGSHGHF